jgi:hypothetical protein
VLVVTDVGLRELLPGSHRLTPIAEPGLLDVVAATDTTRAARLDIFGRVSTSIDGGKSWMDLSPWAGIAVRSLAVGDREVMIDTWQGRYTLGADGKLGSLEPSRGYVEPSRMFQIVFRGTRATEREEWPWGYRDATPLQAAVFAGVPVGDGTAIGVLQNAMARVDLESGKLVSVGSEWIPSGLLCQPVRADDGVLFACTWERYQGYGGYLLRSTSGKPPEPERAFTDDGMFAGDDVGALGFAGSCQAERRLFDPEDMSSREYNAEPVLKPVFCVRKTEGLLPGAAAEWVERSVDISDGSTLIAWVPRKDGTAIALLLSGDPLPERAHGAARVTEQGGVRVIRLYRDLEPYAFTRASSPMPGRSSGVFVDKRFAARADGSIDGWLSPSQDEFPPVHLGVTILPDGRAEVHEMPPGMSTMTVTGDYGVALSVRGELYETTDHGRTWRFGGTSPVPPSMNNNAGGCSSLGCSIGAVVRLGWGDAKLAPRVSLAPIPIARDPWTGAALLQCSPAGSPAPITPPPAAPAGSKQTARTMYGEPVEIVRDQAVPEPAPNTAGPTAAPLMRGMLPPVGTAVPMAGPSANPAAGKPPRSVTTAVLRTHSLVFRPPFELTAPPRRLNVTDASFKIVLPETVTPLLGPGAGDAGVEVNLLIAGATSELLVAGDKVTSVPLFEQRRPINERYGTAGLTLPGGHALLLGELRRRLAIEEHGASPSPPPLYLGVDRDGGRRRPMTLGRREDGAIGVIVFEGNAPATVGVAEVERRGEGVLGFQKLAPWSTVVTADDPRCAAGRDAYRALVVLDASTWFELDPIRLPGVTFARQGLALVRWGKESVCLEALDASVTDTRRLSDGPRQWSLVARWGGKGGKGGKGNGAAKEVNAALRAPDLRQDLRCAVQPRTAP